MAIKETELKNRLNILTVPLDILSEDQIEQRIDELLDGSSQHQIVLLDLWHFMKARGSTEYAKSVRTAAVVIPTSKLVTLGARFLTGRVVHRYLPFDFIIKLLTILEKKGRSVYLLGSSPNSLQTAASNLRGSFPDLQIVGRCAGYFPREAETPILLAIRKAAPTLIIAGSGIPGTDKWLLAHRKDFAPGISLWCGNCIDIFSGKRKRTSREAWKKGIDFLPDLIRNPLRLFRGFNYIWFFILLAYYRLRKLP